MRHISLFLLMACLVATTSFAQDPDLKKLDRYEFDSEEDYEAFEEDFLNCYTWLQNNPVTHPSRILANGIVVKWLTGTPSVTIKLSSYVTEFSEKNPDLLILFMGGWAAYTLEVGKANADDLEANMKGMEAVLDYYEKGEAFGLVKDGKAQKFIKLRDKGKLRAYIEKNR